MKAKKKYIVEFVDGSTWEVQAKDMFEASDMGEATGREVEGVTIPEETAQQVLHERRMRERE